MIHVRNLTKYYGDYPAVRDVSFDVASGQIVGFLGPNGAGKSTTMRILAGFLTATSGTATVAGHDVFWNSIEVRRNIGYMPESCPLYSDLRVREYLEFRAGIKGVPGRDQNKRIDYVMERCWVDEVQTQLIGTLSKGYRQRVGLADALLANPPVLILDEPTAGLDPAQIRSTRGLIKELGQEHTILLSTHILSEVEATCSDVIIIDRGTVAASSSLNEFKSRADANAYILMTVRGLGDPNVFRFVPGVTGVEYTEASRTDTVQLRITSSNIDELVPTLWTQAAEKGWQVLELSVVRPTLEDLFVQITQGESAALTA